MNRYSNDNEKHPESANLHAPREHQSFIYWILADETGTLHYIACFRSFLKSIPNIKGMDIISHSTIDTDDLVIPKEPGHQQSWYQSSLPGIIWTPIIFALTIIVMKCKNAFFMRLFPILNTAYHFEATIASLHSIDVILRHNLQPEYSGSRLPSTMMNIRFKLKTHPARQYSTNLIKPIWWCPGDTVIQTVPTLHRQYGQGVTIHFKHIEAFKSFEIISDGIGS